MEIQNSPFLLLILLVSYINSINVRVCPQTSIIQPCTCIDDDDESEITIVCVAVTTSDLDNVFKKLSTDFDEKLLPKNGVSLDMMNTEIESLDFDLFHGF